MQDPSIFVGEGLPVAFSSISFLFYFLPLFFIIYYLIPARAKNAVLLAGSLFFYAWGEPRWILLLLASILVTWLLGRAMRPEASAGRRRGLLILGLVFQLGLLVAVKYAGFFFGAFIDLPKLHLPLGVSFYTFHAISYLVDVYRQKTPPQKNLLRLGLYLALFPKLVMGPIVPYHELEPALAQRTIDAQDVSDGCFRFTIGLAKKALLADALAGLVTGIWGDLASLTVLSAWLGLIGYALQLYFDFSGYSDMAIGLGRMLGFRFPENFRYPYLCSSISDFWRRWHISLGSWFKEYLYFPLGGSRTGTLRTLRNLLLVWLATGLWHGRAGTTCCGACISACSSAWKSCSRRVSGHIRARGCWQGSTGPCACCWRCSAGSCSGRRICQRPGGILPACSAAQPGRARRRGCICMISGPYCFSVQLARRRCARSSPGGSARSCSRASARRCRPFWCWRCWRAARSGC